MKNYIQIICFLLVCNANAQTLNWTAGLGSGNINSAISWGGATPSSVTNLLISAASFTGAMTTITVTVPTPACAANNFSIDVPAGKTVNLNLSLAGNKLTLNGAITVSGTGTLNIIGSNAGELSFYNNTATVKTHSFTTTTFFKGPDMRFRIGAHVVNGVVDMNNSGASDIYIAEEGSQTFVTNVTFNAPVTFYQSCSSSNGGTFNVSSLGGGASCRRAIRHRYYKYPC